MSNKHIATLFSDDMTRTAIVAEEKTRLVVHFYRNEVLIESRDFPGRSVRYAEDAAENYVTGVLKIDK